MWSYGWDWSFDIKELINGYLCSSDRIFHCEDDIIGDLDELANQRKIRGARRNRQRSVSCKSGHEHAGDIGHSARNTVGRINGFRIESQVPAEFF